jgi:hypothetical protein
MNRKEVWLIFFLLFWSLFFILSCQGTRVIIENEPSPKQSPSYKKEGPPPWAPAHGYRAKHRYRYYPSSRVYHDKERGVYFYYSDGQWRVTVSLPSIIRIDVGDYVTLEMDTDKPYEWDQDVIKKYPPGQMKKKHKKKKKNK